MSSLDPEKILEFHSSGNGRKLRQAMTYFERGLQTRPSGDVSGLDSVVEASERLKAELIEASRLLISPDFQRKTRTRDHIVEFVFRGAGIAAGAVVGGAASGTFLGAIGGGALINHLFTLAPFREQVMGRARRIFMSPGLANLWDIRRSR